MERLQVFRNRVDEVGTILWYSDLSLISAWDTICRSLKIGGEHMVYCSPEIFAEIKKMLMQINATSGEGIKYGTFLKQDLGAMEYLSEGAFSRGDFEFYLIVKPIEGAVIIPHGEIRTLERRSINIKKH